MPDQHTVAVIQLGNYAQGTIEPAPRIQRGEITETEVDDFIEALKGQDLYDKIDSFMPKCCVDGRHRLDGTYNLGANTAGGVFSLLVADMLTTQTFRLDAMTTEQYASNLFDYLQRVQAGTFGGHTADLVADPMNDSGCGAIDKMAAIISLIAQHGDGLVAAANALGIAVDSGDAGIIIGRAKQITNENGMHISSGKKMISVLATIAGTQSIETLAGVHNEVAVVINEQEGTTLNRVKVRALCGDSLQAFNYDRWAMRKAVRTISQGASQSETRLTLAAVDLYNLAVTCVLAGASLRAIRRTGV